MKFPDMPLTLPEGRRLRFEKAKSGRYLISFFDRGRALPGLQNLEIPEEAVQALPAQVAMYVLAPQIGKLELRTNEYDVSFWLGVIEVGRMNRKLWNLGISAASKPRN